MWGGARRGFGQNAIGEWPDAIAGKTWAASLLRVLERATQARAGERYQTVQEFWDEFSDAALPPTLPLGLAQQRVRPISDLSLETEVLTETAPPKPRFETSRELQHKEVGGNGAPRPRLVVPINGAATAMQTADYAKLQPSGKVTVSVPRSAPVRAGAGPPKPESP